jgi:hypothetical protein
MSGADVLLDGPARPPGRAAPVPAAGPVPAGAGGERLAAEAIDAAVESLLGGRPRGGHDEVAALRDLARAAGRRLGARRAARADADGGADDDAPVPAAGWWSFALQLPGVDLPGR